MTKNINEDKSIEKSVDIYDFSEKGFKAWYNALSNDTKKAIGKEPINLPPNFIIETIKSNPKIGLETIFIPEYEDLVKYGRAARLRIISLAITDKYACSRLTYLINTLKKYKNDNKDMFKKVTLIAEDMKEASKNILGKKIAKSIYRKKSIEMITSTMGTITKIKTPSKQEPDKKEITYTKTPSNQNSSIPSVD